MSEDLYQAPFTSLLTSNLKLADAGHGPGQENEEHAGGGCCGRLAALQRGCRKVCGHQRRRARRVSCQAGSCTGKGTLTHDRADEDGNCRPSGTVSTVLYSGVWAWRFSSV